MTLFTHAAWQSYERQLAVCERLRRQHRPRKRATGKLSRILHNILREELRHG